MGFKILTLRILLVGVLVTFATGNLCADEVIIDGKTKSKVNVGDFDCSKCPTPTNNIFSLFNGKQGDVDLTAGELWKFFDSQGINSVDRLTLCLDLQPSEDPEEFGIKSMALKIEDPANFGSLLTDVDFGDDKLVIPGYDISSFRPEAKLEINLGYDFMKRFSASSTEKISLDLATEGDANVQPVVSVEGGTGFFTKRLNTIALIGFAIFWTLVFLALNKFTKPNEEIIDTHHQPAGNQRALSA